MQPVAQHLGVIHDIPEISTQQIDDKSKSVAIMKILLLYPIIHVIYTVIIRVSESLTVSQLELAVCTYAFCTCLAIFFYWFKSARILPSC
jgi:hypothetical protein